jgi:uncharacterized protein YbjT (DUF2867 family)
MAPILVTGGTGLLGRLLVQRLQAGGHPVRVLSRRPQPGVGTTETVTGDLRTGAGLDGALAGVGTVVHCASDGRAAREVDVAGTGRLVEAARAAGGPHLVYVSIVGIDAIPLGYYRAKLAAEQVIERAGLPWTIQRATQFPQLLETLLSALARSPVLPLPRGFRFQPVDPGEVADRLAEHVRAGPAGHAADLGGPLVHELGDLAGAWLRVRGRRRAIVRVPVPGGVGRAFRAGANLCPEHRDGHRTWLDYLADTPG